MCAESELKDRNAEFYSLPHKVEKMKQDPSESEERTPEKKIHRQSVAGCMSFLARKLDALRMEHFQFCAVAVVICFASMQLFPLLTRRSHQESLSEAEPGSTTAYVWQSAVQTVPNVLSVESRLLGCHTVHIPGETPLRYLGLFTLRADVIELKKDPQYCRSYRKFRRFHGLSAMLVVTSLMCNTVYLYYLTSQCNLL
ncbi:hypothetical protein PoB_001867400 [Plakobranchus ocellatus]|uniref:Uncharacterized protein n=1 Tax=Plakobranchus ocellatus TaxID=259542 RepID=A0AAV3ZE48_9GAST|nr:hypothetical protein PoB_001867400 [Plakobranchus ocellatus]